MGSNSISEKVKRNRSENWGNEEVNCLVNALEPCYAKLFGKFFNSLTLKKKNAIWAVVADKVNACNSTKKRDVNSIKNKVKDMKSRAKDAAAKLSKSRNKTGSGDTDEEEEVEDRFSSLHEWQRKIISLMQVEAVDGIKGGIDGTQQSLRDGDITELQSAIEDDDTENIGENEPITVSTSTNLQLESSLGADTPRSHCKRQIITPSAFVIVKIPNTDWNYFYQKKKVLNQLDQTSEKMLEVQQSILKETGRIADALEEKNFLKKYDLKLNPFVSAQAQIILPCEFSNEDVDGTN